MDMLVVEKVEVDRSEVGVVKMEVDILEVEEVVMMVEEVGVMKEVGPDKEVEAAVAKDIRVVEKVGVNK